MAQVRWSQPDFLILGITTGDGVMVAASSSLTQIDLSMEVERIDYSTWDSPVYRSIDGARWWSVGAQMHDLHIVYASDYATAFARLFEDWDPPMAKRVEIGPGRKAIDPAVAELVAEAEAGSASDWGDH